MKGGDEGRRPVKREQEILIKTYKKKREKKAYVRVRMPDRHKKMRNTDDQTKHIKQEHHTTTKNQKHNTHRTRNNKNASDNTKERRTNTTQTENRVPVKKVNTGGRGAIKQNTQQINNTMRKHTQPTTSSNLTIIAPT